MVKNKLKIKTKKGKNLTTGKEISSTVWNPFEMFGETNRLYMQDPWNSPSWLRHWGWHRPWGGLWLGQDIKEIPIDLIDNGKEYKIITEMPGVEKEDIEITVTSKNISICGKMENENKQEEQEYLRQERSYSTLCRNMILPEEVNPDKAEATLKEGILEVRIAKKTQIKGKEKTIPVK